MTAGGSPPRLPAKARRAARRFAEVVCPPGMTTHHRTERVLDELDLVMGALAPEARKALTVTLVILDEAARLYPRSRGRRFTRLDDQAAEAYVRALLTSRSTACEFVRRLKGVVVMCYYELPQVQREIGYDPAPYIAAVSRRRLASYGPAIRAAEATVTARTPETGADQVRSDQSSEAGGPGDAGAGLQSAEAGLQDGEVRQGAEAEQQDAEAGPEAEAGQQGAEAEQQGAEAGPEAEAGEWGAEAGPEAEAGQRGAEAGPETEAGRQGGEAEQQGMAP